MYTIVRRCDAYVAAARRRWWRSPWRDHGPRYAASIWQHILTNEAHVHVDYVVRTTTARNILVKYKWSKQPICRKHQNSRRHYDVITVDSPSLGDGAATVDGVEEVDDEVLLEVQVLVLLADGVRERLERQVAQTDDVLGCQHTQTRHTLVQCVVTMVIIFMHRRLSAKHHHCERKKNGTTSKTTI